MQPLANDDPLMFGVVVLSAKRAVNIPVLSQVSLHDHIPGVVFHGRSGGIAPNEAELYVPSRHLSHKLYASLTLREPTLMDLPLRKFVAASTGEALPLKQLFSEVASETCAHGQCLVLEQLLPFGLLGLHSNEGGLKLFGLYSDACDLLVWTNSPDLDQLLKGPNRKDWKIYRFKEHTSFTAVISTRRVCQRWFRWSSTLPSSDVKFQALEASLFNSNEQ